jgi:hypothetical protein
MGHDLLNRPGLILRGLCAGGRLQGHGGGSTAEKESTGNPVGVAH